MKPAALFALIAVFAATLLQLSCGNIKPGSPNDQAPEGTIVATGSFSGGTVSGTVSVYEQEPGSYVIRLVAFSTPAESGLQMIPWTPGGAVATYTLRSNTGNQNYFYSGLAGTTWRGGKVVIRSVQQNRDLAEAPLL